MNNKINEIPKREKEKLNQTNKIKEEIKGILLMDDKIDNINLRIEDILKEKDKIINDISEILIKQEKELKNIIDEIINKRINEIEKKNN